MAGTLVQKAARLAEELGTKVEDPAYATVVPAWRPARPKVRFARLIAGWILATASLLVAVAIVPGAHIRDFGAAFAATAVIAILNGLLPPVIAALRLPLTLVLGFVLVFLIDVLLLIAADRLTGAFKVDSFWSASAVALIASAVGVVLDVVVGTNDDDTYTVRVTQRIARRSGERITTDRPGILFLEIDGLALPVLQRAMRDGSAPNMARWLSQGSHVLTEWETDLSSQTGASQCGILLGSNADVPAFRWVEKERLKVMVCSSPSDCAEIERRHLPVGGGGLLAHGGASRGNLLSGQADQVILTVSRMQEEKSANPGYRAFLANGFNVMRALVLFGWEVVLEWSAALRAIRRDIRPRGHRGGAYPFMRAAMCVIVRDLIVFGVLSDMMRGRPAVYATFSSYDEVAHHSGLERADTLEALRKVDHQFGRIDRARVYAPRPYEIVVLSDHGQTQGATFRQRNGYGLEDLVNRSVDREHVSAVSGGDEQNAMIGHAMVEATGRRRRDGRQLDIRDRAAVVLGSGNLGLVYLMGSTRRLTLEDMQVMYPRLLADLRQHPHIGWLLVRSERDGAVVLGPTGARFLDTDRVVDDDPLRNFSATAADHLRRTDRFPHAPDILVGSFYDPALEEGCAFEELVSFHGGIGGPQSRAFLLYPRGFPIPSEPLRGAASIHNVLRAWRAMLNGPEEFPAAEVRVAS